MPTKYLSCTSRYYQTDGRFVNAEQDKEAHELAPRAVNANRHAARREEFIDAGQRLIQTRGYEQFSIEELLAEVGASKGAFYHYFDSKQALLEAIIDRLVDTVLAAVTVVVEDDELPATAKLRAYFGTIASIKNTQREFLLELMNTWFSDDNAIVREKLRREQSQRITPHLAAIIRQGVAEGSFLLADPDQMARVVLAVILVMGDEAGELFLKRQAGEVDFETVERRFATYQTALERILGAGPGELHLVDDAILQAWFN
jgi:AcrR family transcriptional regulator